ncbi:hypothetical protein [Riemerella columbipharyngis]|uniref:Uncharacterized protein n=1 Tax=Riemerella columbipharyngis TaxID=1071918 RepID=A0A1G7FBK5_9FLAO|nr:hypothetical protein [Riemerella columbipharyngis]SDE73224.1 hypothetical protein SAMN05421544_12123 [Riemerella columbipharyngis]
MDTKIRLTISREVSPVINKECSFVSFEQHNILLTAEQYTEVEEKLKEIREIVLKKIKQWKQKKSHKQAS